jgi:hypothetical protein
LYFWYTNKKNKNAVPPQTGSIIREQEAEDTLLSDKFGDGAIEFADVNEEQMVPNPNPKMDLAYYSTDTTAQVFHDSRASKRSLEDAMLSHTCTLIATYDTDEAVNSICDLKDVLEKILPDGDSDVSATDVNICTGRPNCRKRNRRRQMSSLVSPTKFAQAIADIHGPLNSTERSLQSIAMPPPTSTPAPGYIVFDVVADELNCTEIASSLYSRIGGALLSVSVDVEGTVELGQVSD